MNKQHLEFSAVLTAKEAGTRLKVSLSWLAKARMRGDGPPYIQIGSLHPLHGGRSRSVDEIPPAPVDLRAVVARTHEEDVARPKQPGCQDIAMRL